MMEKPKQRINFEHNFDVLILEDICKQILKNKIPEKITDASDVENQISQQILKNSRLIDKIDIPIYKTHDAFTDGMPSIRLRLVPKELDSELQAPEGEIKQLVINIPEAFILTSAEKEVFSLATIKITYKLEQSTDTRQYIITADNIFEYEDFSLLEFQFYFNNQGEEITSIDTVNSSGLNLLRTKEKLNIAQQILNAFNYPYVIGAQSRKDNTI